MSENQGLSGDTEQTQTEDQLFAEMSKAVRENDSESLDRLTKEGEVKVEDKKVEEEKVEVKDQPETALKEEVKEELEPKDELTKLREELSNRDKQIHQLKSDAGRVPALQRQLSEVNKKLQEMASKPQTAASARENTRVLSEKLAQIKEADPLLAEAVEEAIKAAVEPLRQENEQIQTKSQEFLKAQATREEEELLDRETAKLLQAVPNAAEVFAHPLWEEWKTRIPPNLMRLATSPYADEVMLAFEQFTKFVVNKHPELGTPAKKEEKVETPVQVVKDPAAERLAAERDKKLKTPTPGSTGVVADKEAEPVDEAKLFAHFYKKAKTRE